MATRRTKAKGSTVECGSVVSSMLYLLLGGMLAISVHFTLDKVIQAQVKVAHEVNVSHQQRMLVQRTSLFATAYLFSGDRAAKQTSLQALGQLQAHHQQLLNEHYNAIDNEQKSPLSNALQALYLTSDNNVNSQLHIFSEQIYHVLDLQEQQDDESLEANVLMELAYTPLLRSLTDVARHYETQDYQRIATLRLVQVVIFWFIVFILFIGLIVILLHAKKQRQEATISHVLDIDSEQLSPMLNRFAFELSASKLIATARRHNESMSVLAFDIDRFPRILANHGQEAATSVLTRVATTILSVCRESDYLGRIEDEKFILLLPKTSSEQAVCLANKIRLYFQEDQEDVPSNTISISVSIGVSELNDDDNLLQQIIARAEQALGRRRNEGRARVCIA